MEEFDTDYQEINIFNLLKRYISEWRLTLKFCFFSVLVGIIIAVSLPKEYKTSFKVIPEANSSNNSTMSSLASMAGFNISSGSTPDAISPNIYPEVVSSVPFLVDLFSLPVTLNVDGNDVSMDLYEYVGSYTKFPWWKNLRKIPFFVKDLFFRVIHGKKNPRVLKGYDQLNLHDLTSEQKFIINLIKRTIDVETNKKSGLITTTVTCQDPVVTNDLCMAVVDNLQKYVVRYRTEKARKDLNYYKELCEEAKDEYIDAQQQYARYTDSNQGAILQRVKIEQERLQNNVQLSFQIYNQCALQVQSGKAKLQQQTPVFTVLEPSSIPLREFNKPIFFYIITFAFFGACISALWIFAGRKAVSFLRSS